MTKYQLRSLKAKDAMTVLSLVQKLGLRDPIKAIFEGEISQGKEMDDKATSAFGLRLIDSLVEAVLPRVEEHSKDVHEFLGDLANLSPEEVEELPLVDYIGLYKSFFTHPDFKELASSLTSSMKS